MISPRKPDVRWGEQIQLPAPPPYEGLLPKVDEPTHVIIIPLDGPDPDVNIYEVEL